jgi:hypothetical protein
MERLYNGCKPYLGVAEKVVCEEREQGTLNWEQFQLSCPKNIRADQ